LSTFWPQTNWSGSENIDGEDQPLLLQRFLLPLQFVHSQNMEKASRMAMLASQARFCSADKFGMTS